MQFKLVFNSNSLRKCVTVISSQTWYNVWIMLFISRSRVRILLITVFLTLPYDQPSSILFMPHSSWMFSASLSRTFSKWGGITIWGNRHEKKKKSVSGFRNQHCTLLLLVYLASFNRCGDEGGLRQEVCCSQQISDSIYIPLVLFHLLHLHLLFWQQGFITRSVTRWRQEFKVTMSAAQQETYPKEIEKLVTCVFILLFYTQNDRRKKS